MRTQRQRIVAATRTQIAMRTKGGERKSLAGYPRIGNSDRHNRDSTCTMSHKQVGQRLRQCKEHQQCKSKKSQQRTEEQNIPGRDVVWYPDGTGIIPTKSWHRRRTQWECIRSVWWQLSRIPQATKGGTSSESNGPSRERTNNRCTAAHRGYTFYFTCVMKDHRTTQRGQPLHRSKGVPKYIIVWIEL